MEMTRGQRLRRGSVAIAEPEELTQLRNFDLLKELDQRQLEEESFWRDAQIDKWSFGIVGLGVLLLLLSMVPVPGSRRELLPPLRGSVRRSRAEVELTEGAYASAMAQGFASPEAAVRALAMDELRRCTYCGGELEVSELGEVMEIHYFKKRPTDVSLEHRQLLGSCFQIRAVESRECRACGHTVRR